LSFRKGRLQNVKIFESILQEYHSNTQILAGDSIEYLFRLYFMLEKEKTFNFFKNQFPNLSSDQIEFRETEKNLNDINIDIDISLDWNVKKLLILWPPQYNPCFDFMTIAKINDQSTNDELPIDTPQTTKMSYQIGLYQIGISTDIKTKLESDTFGINDKKFVKNYKKMLDYINANKMCSLKYYLIHGREDKHNEPYHLNLNYDVSIIADAKNNPINIQLYSMKH